MLHFSGYIRYLVRQQQHPSCFALKATRRLNAAREKNSVWVFNNLWKLIFLVFEFVFCRVCCGLFLDSLKRRKSNRVAFKNAAKTEYSHIQRSKSLDKNGWKLFFLFVCFFFPENQQSTAIISQELSQVAAHRGSVQASILESHSSRLIKKETDFSDPPRHTAGRNVVKYNYTAVSRS